MIDIEARDAYYLTGSESLNVDYARIFRIFSMSVRYSSPLSMSLTCINAVSDDPQPLMCKQNTTKYLGDSTLLPSLLLISPRRHLPV